MDFFKLQGSNDIVSSESVVTHEAVSKDIEEKEMMSKMKQELDAIEQRLENEESFVAFFMKYGDAENSPIRTQFDDSSCFLYKSDYLSDTETKKSATFNGVVNLETACGDMTSKLARDLSDDTWIEEHTIVTENGDDLSGTDTKKSVTFNGMNGDIVAYRVKTLCGDMTSKLACDLSDDAWVEEHRIVTENGKACILMEYPGWCGVQGVSGTLSSRERDCQKREEGITFMQVEVHADVDQAPLWR